MLACCQAILQRTNIGMTLTHVMCREAVEAAVRASVQVVDAAVLSSAEQQHNPSGTTAVFALAFDQHILVGHLGDSKAVLCQQQTGVQHTASLKPAEGQNVKQRWAATQADKEKLTAVPLTADHTPDHLDEHARILAAGGTVSTATAGKRAAFPSLLQCMAVTFRSGIKK